MPDSRTPEPRSWRDRPLVQLTLARYREFYREPEALFWTFVFPILMAAGLGLAFRSKPPERVKVGVTREVAGADRLAARLDADSAIEVRLLDDTSATRELNTGRIALLLAPADTGPIEFRYDDTRPDGVLARRIVDDALQRAAGRTDPVAIRESLVREPGSRYIDFLIPGLLGMNLMASGIWGLGFTVVDQRRKKLLKRFVATPMSRTDYLMSFILSRLTWLVLEVAALVGAGVWIFGVPLRGPVTVILAVCLLSAFCFGGLGLLLGSRVRTVEGASGLMNLAMVPMWVFSGVFFSSSNFPAVMQPFIQALPLTAVNDALRANMLEGAGFGTLIPEFAVIAVWTVVCFAVALRIFRWQ